MINPINGSIYTIAQLDRETEKTYRVQIVATEQSKQRKCESVIWDRFSVIYHKLTVFVLMVVYSQPVAPNSPPTFLPLYYSGITTKEEGVIQGFSLSEVNEDKKLTRFLFHG